MDATFDIFTLIVCILFMCAAFRVCRLERKLSDEKANAKFWKSESESQAREMEVLKQSAEYYKKELEEREAMFDELRRRYQQQKIQLFHYAKCEEGKEGETLPS